MRAIILGAAAGGGFPQWNCSCPNCSAVRGGRFHGTPRSQAQLAISNGGDWFLLNAGPDLRAQIESTPALHPQRQPRHSPITGALLPCGDLDQVMGLLLLREWQQLCIYASASVRRMILEDNSMFSMLSRVTGQTRWVDIVPGEPFPLCAADGSDSGLRCYPLALPAHYPSYVPKAKLASLPAEESRLGLIVESPQGSKLAFLPGVASLTPEQMEMLADVDVLLFDGTFWDEEELMRIQPGTRTAGEMGHMPVSGEGGSLTVLAGLRKPRKVYIHINNTNPMLDESGPQYRAVCDAGWECAKDGWEIELP